MRPDSDVSWRAYPALGLAFCFTLGVVVAGASGWGFWTWTSAAGLGWGLALGASFYGRRRLVSLRPLLATLVAGLVVFALGGARYAFDRALPPDHLAQVLARTSEEGGTVVLEGRVADDPVATSGRTRFVLSARRRIAAGDTADVRGRVQVTFAPSRWAPEATYPHVERGDRLRVEGRLRPPPRPRNPADFDYGSYLERRGIYALLSVYDREAVGVVGAERTVLDRVTGAVRRYAEHYLQVLLPTERGRMVLSALVLGDRSRIDDATREGFARTGLMHLLAVSGLHVLLVGMVLYGLLRPLGLRLRLPRQAMEVARAAITMAVLGLYMLITGGSASTVRAVVMAGLFIGGALLQRPANTLNALGVAALVLLVARPAALFDVGFQLSFAAVGAIVTLGRRFTEAVPGRWRRHKGVEWTASMVGVSLAATLGTMPVLLYHFGFVSFAGLALNLVAIPLTTGTLSAALAMLAFGGWAAPVAGVFGYAADALAQGLVWAAMRGEQALGWAAWTGYVDDVWTLLAMTAALILLVQWPRPRLRWRWAVLTMLFVTSGWWTDVATGTRRPRLEVIFFDVGQGDAALVSLPNGRHLLIDAGPRDGYTDQGARTILPHLERYGIEALDAVVVSHPHSDHLGGLPALLRAVPVHRVIHNGDIYPSELYRETMHLLDSLAIPHGNVRAGDTLALDGSVRLQVLSPEPGPLADEANDASVVLRLVYGKTTFLFTGDAEKAAEEQIIARYGPLLGSTVVKVGHHGSSTSSTPALVRLATADSGSVAVVSVARHNTYGLPSADVLERWRAQGADVRATADHGALWLRSDGKRVWEVDWR